MVLTGSKGLDLRAPLDRDKLEMLHIMEIDKTIRCVHVVGHPEILGKLGYQA